MRQAFLYNFAQLRVSLKITMFLSKICCPPSYKGALQNGVTACKE